MSTLLRNLKEKAPLQGRKLTRDQVLALAPKPDWSDGRTKQAFKDETDINKILKRAQATGTLSHLQTHEAQYGDFANFDYFQANLNVIKGREIFDDLPSEIRKEFNQNPGEFFKFVNDPKNVDKLHTVLPGLAEPGRQNIDVAGLNPPADPPAEPTPADPPADPPEAAEPPAVPST